jgi:hypothetical protein
MDTSNTITISKGRGPNVEWSAELPFPKPQSQDEWDTFWLEKLQNPADVNELAYDAFVVAMQSGARRVGSKADATARDAKVAEFVAAYQYKQRGPGGPKKPKHVKISKPTGIAADALEAFKAQLAAAGVELTIE